MAGHVELADSIISYQETRLTPHDDWREAVREALMFACTEARIDTLKAIGCIPTNAGPDGTAYWILQVDGSEV